MIFVVGLDFLNDDFMGGSYDFVFYGGNWEFIGVLVLG